jgi:hypothetical protein
MDEPNNGLVEDFHRVLYGRYLEGITDPEEASRVCEQLKARVAEEFDFSDPREQVRFMDWVKEEADRRAGEEKRWELGR